MISVVPEEIAAEVKSDVEDWCKNTVWSEPLGLDLKFVISENNADLMLLKLKHNLDWQDAKN